MRAVKVGERNELSHRSHRGPTCHGNATKQIDGEGDTWQTSRNELRSDF